jgi:hypothetical protein
VDAEIERLAVAIDQERHIHACPALPPDVAIKPGEIADLGAADGEDDVAGLEIGAARRAVRSRPRTSGKSCGCISSGSTAAAPKASARF